MNNLLKEPLLHFLLLGLILFGVYSLTSNEQESDETVVISNAKKAQLVYSFQKTRARKPTTEELNALINSYYKTQVAYKKGVEMGLLEGDEVIQRRIQQKVEFIVEDALKVLVPTDKDLNEFLTKNQDNYRSEQVFNFSQIFLAPAKQANLSSTADEIQEKIQNIEANNNLSSQQKSEQLLALSDDIYLDFDNKQMSYSIVARSFGRQFADALVALPLDSWQSEVKSGYGRHIVKVTMKKGGNLLPLSQVKEQVKQDWLKEQRKQSLASFYQLLFDEYNVNSTVENTLKTSIE